MEHWVNGVYDEVVIVSDDFTHDAHLKIIGDFKDVDEKKAYAQEIAKRLNTFKKLNTPT